ncbi:MAG: T9SS type A sorting domain-containing protein [Chitinophagales bacterium]|nr:T9SS type A sorting domain-containing protein [Chitinophagales bacterium]
MSVKFIFNTICLFCIAGSYSSAISQTFCETLGDAGIEYAGGITSSADTGFVIAGRTNSYSGDFMDFYFAKLNANGELLWSTVVKTEGEDLAKSIIQNTDGTFTGAGSSYSFTSNYDVAVIHLGSEGELLWAKYFGDSYSNNANKIIQTADQGYALAGYSDTMITTGAGFVITFLPMVMKLNDETELEWVKRFSYCDDCTGEVTDMLQLQDGGFLLTGYVATEFSALSTDIFIAKFDAEGDFLWLNKIGKEDIYETAVKIIPAINNGYIISGTTYETGESYDMYFVKADEDGNVLWEKTIDFGAHDEVTGMIKTADNQYAVSGIVSTGDYDYGLLKLDSNLTVLFSSVAGNETMEYASGLIQSDTNYIVSGTTMPEGSFADDLYFVKFNGHGYSCCKVDSGGIVTNYTSSSDMNGSAFSAGFTEYDGAENFSGGILTTYCMDTLREDTTIIIDLVSFIEENSSISIYPDASFSFIYASLHMHAEKMLRIHMHDISGKSISAFETTGNPVIQIDIHDLPKGIYFLSFSSDAIHETHTFMKE